MSETIDPLELWDRTQATQRDLYERALQRVNILENTVDDLKEELSAFRTAFASSSKEAKEHLTVIASLKQSLADSLNRNACSVAIIDGDGYPFAPDLIRAGRAGGQNAATALRAKLTMGTSPDEQLLIFVYLNRLGMSEHLHASKRIRRTQDFDDFVRGFNQASPLFHMIDVGQGKEVADAKIRDICKFFAHSAQTRRIYFAGGHDGGYASFLRSLRTDGVADKLVMLRSDAPFARTIQSLDFEEMDCRDLFFDFDSIAVPSSIPQTNQPDVSRPTAAAETFPISALPFIAGNLCLDFYFSTDGCPDGTFPRTCRYVHDPTVPQGQIENLRYQPAALEMIRSFRGEIASYKAAQVANMTAPPPAYPIAINTPTAASSTLAPAAPAVAPTAAMKSPSNASNTVSGASRSASSASNLTPINPATKSKFTILIEVLKSQHGKGESGVIWTHLGRYLYARDKAYLSKAGFDSLKLYLRRAKESGVILIKDDTDDNNLSTISLSPQWR